MKRGDVVISQEDTLWFAEGALGIVTRPGAWDNGSIIEVRWISGAKEHHSGITTWWTIKDRVELIGHVDE